MTAVAAAPGRGTGRDRPGWGGLAWVAWRQHRAALAGVAALLGACALGLGITGLRMQSAHAALTRGGCPMLGASYTSRCGRLETAYYHAGYPLTSNVSLVATGLWALPVLIISLVRRRPRSCWARPSMWPHRREAGRCAPG